MLAVVPIAVAAALLPTAWLAQEEELSPIAVRPVPAAAKPYVAEREFTSPMTGEKFVATVLRARPPQVAADYDYCPHSTFNQLAYTLVTDPSTGWTNYPEIFSEPTPLPASKLAAVLGAPKFDRQAVAGMPWLDPYPWEQFENAALQSAALDRSPLDTANWYIQAAWSVRLDLVSGGTGFEDEISDILRKMPKAPANQAEIVVPYELQLAALWEQQRVEGVLQGVPPAQSALALAWVYRSRGELPAARHWLGQIDNSKEPSAVQGFLADSIALEESYLGTAREWLLAGWNDGKLDDRKVGRTAFALGEIARRLGDRAGAQRWYGEAGRRQHGELNLGTLAYVQALAQGRGY
jgi:hypothetical protein